MNDTIYRQDAIEGLYDVFFDDELSAAYPKEADKVLDVIRKLPSASCQQVTGKLDLVDRRNAIDALEVWVEKNKGASLAGCLFHWRKFEKFLDDLPSAQPERDIPVNPIETTDKAWGIPHRQAVCPKCDYYLGHVAFLGDYKGKRITYCETCGQAINWEGWEFDG